MALRFLNLKFSCLIIVITLYWEYNAYGAPASQFANNYYYQDYQNNTCRDTETGIEMYVGEGLERPGRCIRIQCLGTLEIWQDKCQIPKLYGNCTTIPAANEFLKYPLCCPLYQCKRYQFNEYGKALETRTFDHYGVQTKIDVVQEFLVTFHKTPNNSFHVTI